MKYLDADSFIQKNSIPIIDVRSPAEYEKGHITGSVNIPLFSDQERHFVGIEYKKMGKVEAIAKGLQFVGPKMQILAEQAKNLDKNKARKIYCWRGGMRSEKMAWLFELLGMQCSILNGGYKSYRNKMLDDFIGIEHLTVLHGSTGCAKTEILQELSNLGEQVIDLEEIANHRGSTFGHLGKNEQPTSQQFQNNIHSRLLNFDFTKRIWVEAESLKIGNVNLPDTLWMKMKKADVIEIKMDTKIRANKLADDYGHFPLSDLLSGIERISDGLGGDRTKLAMQNLKTGKLAQTAEILLDYYDRTYEFTRQRFRDRSLCVINLDTNDPKKNARVILDHFQLIEKTVVV